MVWYSCMTSHCPNGEVLKCDIIRLNQYLWDAGEPKRRFKVVRELTSPPGWPHSGESESEIPRSSQSLKLGLFPHNFASMLVADPRDTVAIMHQKSGRRCQLLPMTSGGLGWITAEGSGRERIKCREWIAQQ